MRLTFVAAFLALLLSASAMNDWTDCEPHSLAFFGGHHKLSLCRWTTLNDDNTCNVTKYDRPDNNCLGTARVRDGTCHNFKTIVREEHRPTNQVKFTFPGRGSRGMDHCELTVYSEKDCEGVALTYLTNEEEKQCTPLHGNGTSAMLVCGRTWDRLYEKGGTPWKDKHSTYHGMEREIVEKHFLGSREYAECVRRDCIRQKGGKCDILKWVKHTHGCSNLYLPEGQVEWRPSEDWL